MNLELFPCISYQLSGILGSQALENRPHKTCLLHKGACGTQSFLPLCRAPGSQRAEKVFGLCFVTAVHVGSSVVCFKGVVQEEEEEIQGVLWDSGQPYHLQDRKARS